MNCKKCKTETERRSAVQKYCLKCSEEMNLLRMNKTVEESRYYCNKKSKEGRLRYHTRGNKINENWFDDFERPKPNFIHVWELPFTWDLSKNRIYSLGSRRGHVFIRSEVKQARARIEKMVSSIKDKMFRGKVWIDILVEKPNNKGDAVNFVDSICDAIKKGLDIDDRYFSIGRVDWRIRKINPQIYLAIYQTIMEHHFYCMYCGRARAEVYRKTKKDVCIDCLYGLSPEIEQIEMSL